MNDAPKVKCGMCGEMVNMHSCISYEDAQNGVEHSSHCCRPCVKAHIVKFYPDSPLAQFMLKRPDKWERDE